MSSRGDGELVSALGQSVLDAADDGKHRDPPVAVGLRIEEYLRMADALRVRPPQVRHREVEKVGFADPTPRTTGSRCPGTTGDRRTRTPASPTPRRDTGSVISLRRARLEHQLGFEGAFDVEVQFRFRQGGAVDHAGIIA